MTSAGQAWHPLRLNILGRVHVAKQCLASKAVYQAPFNTPSPEHLEHMQQAINRFVASSALPEEVTPRRDSLFPKADICLLPVHRGGLGLPDINCQVTAGRAKSCWQAVGFASHPWVALFRHEVGRAVKPESLVPPGMHWVVSCPAEGDAALIRSAYTRASVLAFLELGVRRVLQPGQQHFYSVMLELVYANDFFFCHQPGGHRSGTPDTCGTLLATHTGPEAGTPPSPRAGACGATGSGCSALVSACRVEGGGYTAGASQGARVALVGGVYPW